MILWMDGAHDPRENMRRDRRLLETLARRGDAAESVLRVFRFAPAGITLGHSQSPERELDLDRCRAEGVPWAVRPSGGRAIFHADEWTYSLAAPIADPEWGGSLTRAYERASHVILAALQRLGVPATLARRGAGSDAGDDAARAPEGIAPGAGAPASGRSSPACFAAVARHEILLEGRKLVGSAQRRVAGALLQQGSILIGPGHLRLVDYVAVADARRDAWRATLRAGSTDAARYLGGDIRLERFAGALAKVLPSGTQRVEGRRGLLLLTLSEAAPYTRAAAPIG